MRVVSPAVRAVARAYGWEATSSDWKAVVENPEIDLVDVATPGDSHAEIAIAAAQAGKIVLCEKPLANSVKDAERMLAAVERAGVPHMICHNYRRVPAVMLAKQLIKEGRIGRVRHFRGTCPAGLDHRSRVSPRVAARPHPGRLGSPG